AEEWRIVRKQKEVEIDNIIAQYLNTPLDMQGIFCPITSHPQVSTSSGSLQTAIITIAQPSKNLEEFYPNAVAQKKAAESKRLAEKELIELEFLYNNSSNIQHRRDLLIRMNKFRDEIQAQKQQIKKLKRNAIY
ncbi:36460_t:CDS:1, partial [Gigaspora margarita]